MLRLSLSLLGFLACLLSFVSATALTYKVLPNEKACFFSEVKQQGAKIAFYFAVRLYHSYHTMDPNMSGSEQKLTRMHPYRCNPAAPSTLTTMSMDPMEKSLWKTHTSDRWIRSSLRKRLESTDSALITR